MDIQKLKIKDIRAAAYNPRTDLKPGDPEYEAIRRSIETFGFVEPLVVNKRTGNLVGGHQRLKILQASGNVEVECVIVDLDDRDEKALNVALNKATGSWDMPKLKDLLVDLDVDGFDLTVTGFSDDEIAEMIGGEIGNSDPDEVPEPPAEPITKPGDLWLLGDHRVLCGDSTKAEDVGQLMAGEKAVLIHADPPYGMGKEKDGVQNDNLYAEKLDVFQMAWWKAFRPHTEDNGSAYIWGNAEDLWRLWYRGLKDSERLTFRNEITWDKANVSGLYDGNGIGSPIGRQFAIISERCLFFMLGEQGFNNNADNYWEGWEDIRAALLADCEKMGWGPKDIERICGVGMFSHWFTKSQWSFIPEEHYRKLQAAAREHDAFKREHDAFKREHDELKREFYATRAYFDNTHENMTDVWNFSRVTGEDRHGHATPKPVAMTLRCLKSSSPSGAVVVDPFLGSGTTLIAAEQLGRKCYGMEISPAYCDVIVARWEKFTGKKAEIEKP